MKLCSAPPVCQSPAHPHCAPLTNQHHWSSFGASLAKQNGWENKISCAQGRTVAHEMLRNYIPVKVLCELGQKVAVECVKQTQ